MIACGESRKSIANSVALRAEAAIIVTIAEQASSSVPRRAVRRLSTPRTKETPTSVLSYIKRS